ncbi:MAG: NERD domain-containing protein [Thermoflexales bacterium]|nr:NERD domain-containing protein [Thermoflexales bacterium]
MARIIGSLREKPTHGENRFYNLLRNLPDEFLGWAELPTGDSSQDFVLLHPQLGLFFLEVKDYSEITRSDVHQIEVKRRDGTKFSAPNPVREIEQKAQRKADELKKRQELRDQQGNLMVPWSYAVVFTHLSERHLQLHSALVRYHDRPCVIASNHLENSAKLLEQLKKIAYQRPGFQGLNDRQMKAIQAVLHQETVIIDDGEELSVADPEQQEAALRGIYEEMIQEVSEEGKHAAETYRLRLVRGVAGSGKTFVLGLRAYYLHQIHPEWNILVLTRNYLLANHLRKRLSPLQPKVQVWHWHAFARYMLQERLANPIFVDEKEHKGSLEGIVRKALEQLDLPELSNLRPDYLAEEIEWIKDTLPLSPETLQIECETYLNAERTGRRVGLTINQRKAVFKLFQRYQAILNGMRQCYDYHDHAILLQRAILCGELPGEIFDAVLVDEAQDFAPAWFRVIQHISRNNFFMTADPAQRVFGSFTWRDIGFNVVGRSQILKRPYRNTYEIFVTAYEFACQNEALLKQLEREGEILLKPEIIPEKMRHGPWPVLRQFNSLDEELRQAEREIKGLLRHYNPHDIAILLPTKAGVDKACNFFLSRGFEMHTPDPSDEDVARFVQDRLNVTTLERVRGLEFKVVFICQLQALPPVSKSEDSEEEREEKTIKRSRWLYVGMTRARERLYLSYQSPHTPEIKLLEKVIQEQKARASIKE